jgi:hypothetical protein
LSVLDFAKHCGIVAVVRPPQSAESALWLANTINKVTVSRLALVGERTTLVVACVVELPTFRRAPPRAVREGVVAARREGCRVSVVGLSCREKRAEDKNESDARSSSFHHHR